MVAAADFGAMFASLRAIVDLSKLILDAHDTSLRQEKSIELQRQIIAAQESAMAVGAEVFAQERLA